MSQDLSAVTTLWVRTSEDLFWIGGAGHETRDASYFFDSRTRTDRPHYVLQLTLAGEGYYERNRIRTLLKPGMAFLDMIPGDFRYGSPPGARLAYEQVFVSFTGPACEAICRRITDEFGHILTLGRKSSVETMMLALAHQHASGTLRDRYIISGNLYQLLMTVISTLKSSQLATSPLLHQAIGLVHDHWHEHAFNVQKVAHRLSCSREHLTRQFREATGVSAGDYITQHRLGMSASLLRQTDHKLEVIAHQCGFASANYFCRAFRKRYGITPAQFRRTPWLVTE